MKYILPYSYSWLIKKNIDNGGISSILELGCGKGWFANLVNDRKKYEITGVDIFKPYLDICRESGKYEQLKVWDLTEKLPFKNKSFDAVICLQTIEHLKKVEGRSLIKKMERIARKLVMVSTPNGECFQEEYDDNRHQRHLSSWRMEDFLKRKYEVFGVGLKAVYGRHSCVNAQNEFIKLPLYFLSFLMNPLANKFAEIACQLVAVKRK